MDASARETTPHLMKIAKSVVENKEYGFSENDKKDVRFMLDLLNDFKGNMSLDSVSATVFSYWHYHFI